MQQNIAWYQQLEAELTEHEKAALTAIFRNNTVTPNKIESEF